MHPRDGGLGPIPILESTVSTFIDRKCICAFLQVGSRHMHIHPAEPPRTDI